MHLSLIQRITIGFAIVIVLVVAIAGSAYQSQIRMAQQLELTSSTLTGLLDKSNTVLLDLQEASQAMMQHANTQPPEKRKLLRDKYFAAKDKYTERVASLKEDLAQYPELLTSLNQATTAAEQLFINAEVHLDLHDNRITARDKALSESGNLNDTWDFFNDDLTYFADTAKSQGLINTFNDIHRAMEQASKAMTILQRSLALATSEKAADFQKELLKYHAEFAAEITKAKAALPNQAADLQYYFDELDRAIVQPLGIFQQQVKFLEYNDQSRVIFEDTAQQMEQISAELSGIVSGIRSLSENALVDAEESFNTSVVLNLTLALFSIVIALTIGVTVVRAIRRPLADIMKALNRLSQGDLTETITTQYHSEMGMVVDNINLLINNQSHLIQKVKLATSTINNVAAESLVVSEQTNKNASEQGNQTDIVSTAVTEMEAAVFEIASHAANTNDEVTKVTQQAETNMSNMDLNLEFVNALKASLDSASQVIQELSTESENIGSVLSVIQGINEQTNLLALNAAIEAARAGEHGRGFSVVADEVRSMSTRTQESATEINQMVDSLQRKSKEAVSIVESNLAYADKSVNQTVETRESLQTMLLGLQTINDMSSSIATASEEQSTVVKEVAQNIVNISDMANEIALEAEKAAQNSVSLNKLSNEQSGLVAQFKLKEEQSL